MSSKVDGVLEEVGALGKYQWIQAIAFGLNSLICAFPFVSIVFHSITPKFRCAIDAWGNDSYAPFSDEHNQSIHQWIPTDKNGDLDSCKIYASNSTNNTVECTHYVYDHSVYWGNTLNMEFGMVCSRSYVSTAVKVAFTIGLVVGAAVVGILADILGRKKVMVGCLALGGVCSVVAAFSVNEYMFAALRFVIAACFVGIMIIDHIVSVEITGPSRRVIIVVFRSFCWPVGHVLLSPTAYAIQDWNWFQLAISFPIFISLALNIFLLEETPHFLVTKGRHDEARRLFRKMAKMNGRQVPEQMIADLKEDGESAVSEPLRTILKAPVLLTRTAIFFYLWFVGGFGFYGLNFNVPHLSGNVYVNNAITGAAEIPVGLFVLISQRLGRKLVNVVSLFVGSAVLLVCTLMSMYVDLTVYSAAQITVATLGKLAVSIAFLFDYFWASEIFPTTLRTTLLGLSSMFARIGSILSPIIVDLYLQVDTVFGAGLGTFVITIAMFVAGILSFFLPETKGQKVPETIAEANMFLTKNSYERNEDDLEGDELTKATKM